jgi:hypothetical protein
LFVQLDNGGGNKSKFMIAFMGFLLLCQQTIKNISSPLISSNLIPLFRSTCSMECPAIPTRTLIKNSDGCNGWP